MRKNWVILFVLLLSQSIFSGGIGFGGGTWEGGSTFIDHYPIPHDYDYTFIHTIFNPETGELIQGAGYPRATIPFPGNPAEGNISGHGKLLFDYLTKKNGCAPNIDQYVDEMRKWRGGGGIFNNNGPIVVTDQSAFLNGGLMNPDEAAAHGQTLANNLGEEVKKPTYVGGPKNFEPKDGPGYMPKPKNGNGGLGQSLRNLPRTMCGFALPIQIASELTGPTKEVVDDMLLIEKIYGREWTWAEFWESYWRHTIEDPIFVMPGMLNPNHNTSPFGGPPMS